MAILPCTCSNSFQDRLYGYGNRVCNPTTGVAGKGHRCTVCGHVKSAPAQPKNKSKGCDKKKKGKK